MSDTDIETPLLGGGTTAGNDDNMKNPYFNWLFDAVSWYVKTLFSGANEDRAADLFGAPKNKLVPLSLGGKAEFLESLPKNVRKRVEVLQEIQGQHDELEAKFYMERAALEAKYQKLYEPLYTKRYDIVNGVVEVEGVSGEAIVDKNGNAATEDRKGDKATEEKGVPNFWLTAMKTNEVTADEIQERDEEALKYLKDIKWCRFENLKGFKLEFFFDPNPFFKNTVLTKIYDMGGEDEPILNKAIGTDIEWLPGKNLTQKVLTRRVPVNMNTGCITEIRKCKSFFNFFNPPQVPNNDVDIDDETFEDLVAQMEQHYDIGATIRDTIIPYAVSWFTGEAVEYEEIYMEDDEDYEADEDDSDEDEGNTQKKWLSTYKLLCGAKYEL